MNNILTNREKEVFDLLIKNKSTKEIAKELFISDKTVRNHISNVIQKLSVFSSLIHTEAPEECSLPKVT